METNLRVGSLSQHTGRCGQVFVELCSWLREQSEITFLIDHLQTLACNGQARVFACKAGVGLGEKPQTQPGIISRRIVKFSKPGRTSWFRQDGSHATQDRGLWRNVSICPQLFVLEPFWSPALQVGEERDVVLWMPVCGVDHLCQIKLFSNKERNSKESQTFFLHLTP